MIQMSRRFSQHRILMVTRVTRWNADIAINHLSSALCHLGNMATRVGRGVRFDPATEQVQGDEDAAALVRRQYR